MFVSKKKYKLLEDQYAELERKHRELKAELSLVQEKHRAEFFGWAADKKAAKRLADEVVEYKVKYVDEVQKCVELADRLKKEMQR